MLSCSSLIGYLETLILIMLVFLDDSGDPGFKVEKGSSACFVIALVIFDDPLEAESCAVEIKKLRRHLKLGDHFEFKLSKCCDRFKTQFLSCVSSYKFRVRAIVMRTDVIYSQELPHSKETFYRYSIRMVLQHKARLKMDGHGDKEFRSFPQYQTAITSPFQVVPAWQNQSNPVDSPISCA